MSGRFAKLHFLLCCAAILGCSRSKSSEPIGQTNTPVLTSQPIECPLVIAGGINPDDGTVFVKLKLPTHRRLFCVTGDGQIDDVPRHTLLLNVSHPNKRGGTLPYDRDTVRELVKALDSVVSRSLTEAQLEQLNESNNPIEDFAEHSSGGPISAPWKHYCAAIALRRLSARTNHDLVDPFGRPGTGPAWYAARATANESEYRTRQQEIADSFKNAYPKVTREFLSVPPTVDPKYDVVVGEDDDAAFARQAQKLAKAVGDPTRLGVASCGAFGRLDHGWGMTTSHAERVAVHAVRSITPVQFTQVMEEIHQDRTAVLGAGRLFFAMGYSERLPEEDWNRWGPVITEVALVEGLDKNKPAVLRVLSKTKYLAAAQLLQQISTGRLGVEINFVQQWDEEPGIRESALLGLALKDDSSIRPKIEAKLKEPNSGPNQAALEVCLALLGNPEFIRPTHFEYHSWTIGFGALAAIERFGGEHGMDVLIKNGLDAPMVANDAMLLAQRITGEQWVPQDSPRNPCSFADDAREWWLKNAETFRKATVTNVR